MKNILNNMKSGNYSVKYFRSGKRAKSKSAWGLEIGDSELKATKVKLHNGKLLVEAIDRVEISTMNQSAATTNAEIVENAINNFVTRNEIEKSERIVVSLPAKMVLSRFVSFPPMKKGQIVDAIKYELQKQVPFDSSEIVWDYHQFSDSSKSGNGPEIGIFATKKENIYSVLSSLTPIKSNIEAIQINPIAIYNLVQLLCEQDEDIFVVNVQKDSTDFIVAGKSKYWNRSIPISEMNMDLVREIQRSIGYYVSIAKDTKPENIFLMGEGLKDDDKVKFVRENLEGKVHFLNVLDSIEIAEEVDSAVQNKKAIHSFGTAIGLAVQGLGVSKIKINLLPLEYMRERQKPRQKEMVATLVCLLFFGLLTQGIKDYVSSRALSRDMNTISETQKKVKNFERAYLDVEKKVELEEEDLRALTTIGTKGSFWIESIRTIIEIMPEKVHLLSLNSSMQHPYMDGSNNKNDSSRKKKAGKPVDAGGKVLVMTMKGESNDPGMQYLEERVKIPIANLKLFQNESPSFRDVEFVKGSIYNIPLLVRNRSGGLEISQNMRGIAFEIRWIVNTINEYF
ncbi:MAG: pilus assembly protein PilM [Candidatus Scalindua sp.]|nr:pilus assembly protein PilM [Candidatus Scalindua sp.]